MSKLQFKSTRILTALAANVAAFGLLAWEAVQAEEVNGSEEGNISLNETVNAEEDSEAIVTTRDETLVTKSDLNHGQSSEFIDPFEEANELSKDFDDDNSSVNNENELNQSLGDNEALNNHGALENASQLQDSRKFVAESTAESQVFDDDRNENEGSEAQTSGDQNLEESIGPKGDPEDLGFTVGEAEPVETKKTLDVKIVGRYHSGAPFNEEGTEIAVYNPANDYIYSVNGYEKSVDIIDTNGLAYDNFNLIKRVRLADYGVEAGDVTSVNLHPSRQFIAVAAQAFEKTDPGHVIFLDADGNFLSTVRTGTPGTTNGALPDDTAFTNDGSKLLLAIEGEPNDDYTINPAGGITIVDIPSNLEEVKNINQDHVRFIALTSKDLPNDTNARVVGDSLEEKVLNMEPEFVVVDSNDQYAYVAIQEYNAIGRFNISDEVFEAVGFLGYKDHSVEGNELDPSDRDNLLQPRRQPVLGLHMPDAIDLYEVGGKTYILIPGEGDAIHYDGFSEQTRVKNLAEDGLIRLNAEHYQGYTQEELDDLVKNGLFDDDQLGRLRVTTAHPFINDEGYHEALVSYGSRSFAIVDAETLEIVWDSGADFENIVLARHPEIFNVDVDDRDDFGLDKRSDNKGAEPETVVYGEVNGVPYAFVALERTLGFMIYDISDVTNPVFVDFYYDEEYIDISPEGLQFIPAEDSPTGEALLLAAYEQSGTIGVYQLHSLLEDTSTDGQEHQTEDAVTDTNEDNGLDLTEDTNRVESETDSISVITDTSQVVVANPVDSQSDQANFERPAVKNNIAQSESQAESNDQTQTNDTVKVSLPQTGASSLAALVAPSLLFALGLGMVDYSKKDN